MSVYNKNFVKHMSKQTYHKDEEQEKKSTIEKILNFIGILLMILFFFWIPIAIIGLFTKN
tara:strand:+ start:295 stop:474 length:180 start_codon:yes stop_codon:yes gene_type:complete